MLNREPERFGTSELYSPEIFWTLNVRYLELVIVFNINLMGAKK